MHGYTQEEQARLYRQAAFLAPTVYADVDLSKCQHLLEVGCGVGAQTEILLRRFPSLHITGIDLSAVQLAQAEAHLKTIPEFAGRFAFRQMDASAMTFDQPFDSAFFCWMLEHVPNPVAILAETRRHLRPGSPVYVSEVQNHSLYIHPPLPNLVAYWREYNALQQRLGGDPYVGVRLGNYLAEAGFSKITAQPKAYFYDHQTPELRRQMFQYWAELMQSGVPQLLQAGVIPQDLPGKILGELSALQQRDAAVFFYTFIQAVARA